MRTPSRLPDLALRGAHRSDEREEFGVTRGRLRSGDVAHPHRGVWTTEAPPRTLEHRAREYAPLLLPGQAFSHETALGLVGAPLRDESVLHVSVLFPRTPPRGDGVVGHSLRALVAKDAFGLPVCTPESALLDAAAHCSDLDVVVYGDHLLLNDLATVESLLELCRLRPRAPGSRRLRRACARMRRNVRSRPETELRLAIVDAGLQEPVVEHPVPVAGGIVLHPDLAFLREKVALEYQGDGHRDRETWLRDLHRRELLEAAGWKVIEVTALDLHRDRAAFLRRLSAVLIARRAD